jgi:uncharacterized membrane protein (DUF441 family)
MFARFIRAVLFCGFLAITFQSIAGFLSKTFKLENNYTEFHLTASLILGFLVSYLYKNGLAYTELKEKRHDETPR